MDSRKTKTKTAVNSKKGGELVTGSFPLSSAPVDYQLSVHVNNLLLTYNREAIIKGFKEALSNPERLKAGLCGVRVTQIIQTYGVPKCQEWFTMVYGWDHKPIKTEKVG